MLGQLVRDGCRLGLWYRYTPPDRVGRVHLRYLEVEDRSVPNSMGICYKLFRHPLLVLPVLYHELLHYGGPEGDPSGALDSEGEVLLRETVFMRSLIAQLAPQDDDAIPNFERSMCEEMSRVGLGTMICLLVTPTDSSHGIEPFNEYVRAVYGERLSHEDAERKVRDYVDRENQQIMFSNLTDVQGWCPDKPWPLLGTADTDPITRQYMGVLMRQWTRCNFMSGDEGRRILNDKYCTQHLRAWAGYCGRKHACDVFFRYASLVQGQMVGSILQGMPSEQWQNGPDEADLVRLRRELSELQRVKRLWEELSPMEGRPNPPDFPYS